MKTVKEVCPRCKYAIEYTKGEKVKIQIFNILTVFGFLFIIYIALVGISTPMNNIANSGFQSFSRGLDEEMRILTLNITDCHGDDSYCYAQQLYDNVSQIRYVPSSKYKAGGIYDPLFVYEHGGDCKNTANMYVSFLRSVGITARVDCNVMKKHCVSVVPYVRLGRYRNEKVVVDLTIPMAIRLNDDEDVWDYYEIYQGDSTRRMSGTWSYQR